MTHKTESGIPEEISTTKDMWMIPYVDDAIREESEDKLKSLLIKMKKESEKPGLNLNTQKTKIMATSPITSWQIEGEKWKHWQILLSWAPESLWTATAARKLKDASSLEVKLSPT